MNFDKNLIILVLGMHRSGTSALTSALVSCGGSVGNSLIPASFDNPKGFFENSKIVKFNNKILKTLEMSWDTPLLFPKYWSDRINIEILRLELEEILHQEFVDDKPIIIKDPRICLLFPVWVELLRDYEIFPIVIVREPLQVRKSLYVRNRFGPDKSNILWLNHYIQAANYTQYFDRIITDFNVLLKNPKVEIKKILDAIDDKRLKLNTKVGSLLKNNKSSIVSISLPRIRQNQLANQVDLVYKNLIELKSGNTTHFLENIAHEYLEINNTYIESVLRKDRKQFTLIAVDENGNRLSELKDINLDESQLIFNIKSKSKISELILIPCNDKAYLSLKSIEIHQNGDKLSIHQQNKKVLFEHGIDYVVNSQSFFVYKIDEPTKNFKVEIELYVYAFGVNTIDHLDILSAKLNTWIEKNVNQVKSDLRQKDVALADSKMELEQFKSEFKDLANKLENELEKNKELSNSVNLAVELTNDFEKLKTVKQELLSSKTKITKTLELERVKIEEMKSKIASREYEIDTLKQSMNKEEQRLVDKERELNKTQKELYQKDTEIEVLKLKLEHLESNMQLKIDILKQGMEVLRKENDDYKEKLLEFKQNQIDLVRAELRVENFADKLEVFRNLYNQAQERIEKESTQNKLLQSELGLTNSIQEKILQETDLNKQELENKHEKVVSELLNHLAELEENSSNNQELEELKAKYDAQKSDLEKLLADTNRKLSDKELLISSLQDEIKNSSLLISQKESDITTHKNELENKRKELLEYKIDAQNYSRDLEDVKQSISYKVGAGLTKPARWIYDKTNGETPVNKSRIWLIKNLVLGGIKNPVSAVMKLSPKNLKTLHQAMQSESNETIVKNFNNLVSNKTAKSKIELNHDIGADLESDERANDQNKNIIAVDDIPQNASSKTRILYISPNLPDYDTSSGGKRATRMIELLCEDFEVYVFTLGARPAKYITKLSDVGAIVIQGNDYMQIKRRIPYIDTIIFAWYYTFYDANKFIQLYTDAKIIVDSVDVHWVREERSIGMVEGLTEEVVASNKRKEVEVYKQADIIWTVTENDKQYILKEIEGSDIRVVSNIHDNHVHAYNDNGLNTMLFFGGFNHYPNISAAKNIVENILPVVRKEIPDAKLILAGANAPKDIQALGLIEGVDYRGFIEEEDLMNLYQESFLAVAPLLAGAGIKGKICEAIVYRTPVATNSIGNEGINMVNTEDGFVSEDNVELAQLIVKAMLREFDLNSLTHNAQEKLKDIVGTETVKRNMFSSIMPEVSICIVTWNRLDLLKRCIESIEGNTIYPYYKIIVHSNGCEDGTQEYLEAAASINKKIVPILSKENEVFVIPNNNMMQMFPDNDAVLVNNDVYVTKGWLMELYKAAYANGQIGIAGSKILYPDQSLQEFGSELYENGSGRNIGKHDDPNKDEYKQTKRVGYVSGCSMYIKNKTIQKIGVFDLQFHPCYCEDSDYCYTAWENGIETVVTPNSIIYHDEGGTSGTDEDSGFKAYQKVNFEKFLTKHKHNLADIADKIKSLN